jgi:hypothetical protein
LAYGSDAADGGPQAFEAGSVLSVGFVDGLKIWNSATSAFEDAGATQLKAFRGSDPTISSPPENFAITGDMAPFDSVSLPAVASGYSANAHSSLRFALLGDGQSPSSASPDGVYLLTLQVSSTQSGLASSDPYYFVLHKNAPASDVMAAVAGLGVEASLVQFVPEPSGLATAAAAVCASFLGSIRRRSGCKGNAT